MARERFWQATFIPESEGLVITGEGTLFTDAATVQSRPANNGAVVRELVWGKG